MFVIKTVLSFNMIFREVNTLYLAPSIVKYIHKKDLLSLGTKTLKLCQCDSSFHSGLCFDSEIRLAFENRFDSERGVVQSCPDLNDDAYSDYPELNESLFQSCNLNWVTV